MCNRYLCICCGCRTESPPEKKSIATTTNPWISGEENNKINGSKPTTISTVETIKIEHRRMANIEKHQPRKSLILKPAQNVATLGSFKEKSESPRNSGLSNSTFGDISQIDVRLDIFEEDRFRDISEAIFKKHS